MKRNTIHFSIVLGLGLGLTLILLGLISRPGVGRGVVHATGPTLYVAPSGSDTGDCTNSLSPCATVQYAIDQADSGAEVRVATGVYTDVHQRPRKDIASAGVVTQVVYISKTATLRGGYTTSNWADSYPITQPTTLDAQGQGRLLYITGNISPTLEGLRIIGGNATGLGGSTSGDSGGGVFAISATLTMRNNQVLSHTARYGGGLFIEYNSNTLLMGNTISGNLATNLAGGMYFRNSLGATLISNIVSNNQANEPGAGGMKHQGGARFDGSDNAVLINNSIHGNFARDSCAGIEFNNSASGMLIGNNVISNSAGVPGFGGNAPGGGLCFISSNGASLIGNTVISNSTFGNGGGLYLQRSDITLTNNVVADNRLVAWVNFTGTGSALYIAGSSPRLLHTTIARNSGGDGNGVYVTDVFSSFSDVAMTNTILVSHTAGITASAGNTATLVGVLWYSNTIDFDGTGSITVTHAYTGDPVFGVDGYHLTGASAAIDKGVHTGVNKDVDNEPRPYKSPDLGADEYWPPGTPIYTYLPVVMKCYPPTIELTYVPTYGSFDDLQGRVECVEPADHKVAVYIYVSGWWTKPYFASPLTPIQSDGSWTCDITTGGVDQLATKIAAFLVRDGYSPPLMSGAQTLPEELFRNAVAYVIVEREPVYRTIEFSGYTWKVKASETRAGPGPNYFSDREEDVWVNADGRLHLKIVYRNGRWYATEVFTAEPFGYGTYTFTLASRVDQLDKNVILGLFTWDDTAPDHNYREIDIEFSRWGEEQNDNSQFVVQPWNNPGNLHRFNMALQGAYSTHWFDWRVDRIQFASFQGRASPPGPGDEIESWLYTGVDIPPEGEGNARINLWLLRGNPPSDGQEVEVIIEAFEFVPAIGP